MQEVIRAHLEHVRGEFAAGRRADPFVPSYGLRSVEVEISAGVTAWIGHSGDRRARELAAAGEIVTEVRGGVAHYAAPGATQYPMPL